MSDIRSGGTPRPFLANFSIVAIITGIVLIALAIFLTLSINESREHRRVADTWERHTYEVLLETRELLIALQNAETGNRGYILTAQPRFLAPFDQGMADAPRELVRLKAMTKDNAAQQANIVRLAKVVDFRLGRLQRGVDLVRAGNRAAAIDLVKDGFGKESMDEARAILADINETERALLKQQSARNNDLVTQSDRLIIGLIILMAGMIAYGLAAMISATKAQARNSIFEAERDTANSLQSANAEAVRAAAIVSAIGDATPDAIYAKDRSGRITYANPSTLAVIGKSLAELLGLTTVEYNPNNKEAAEIDANDARIMASGVNEVVDEFFTGPNGHARMFRSTKSPIRGSDGAVIGLAGVSTDVTAERLAIAALKESEGRFRGLSETVPAFIFITDENGEVTFTNSAFQKYTGKTNDELLGMGWARSVHRDDRKVPEMAWAKAIKTKEPYTAEYRFRNVAGEFRCFLCRATPVQDATGQITQWVGTCSDVQDAIDAREAVEALNEGLETKVAERTADLSSALATLQLEVGEREKAEGQVRQMQKLESIGQLTGGIAHDFNNMLAVILGSLEIVKRKIQSDPDRAITAAENAEEGARRAALLTARLLAFSRQQPLAPEPVEANKLVSGMSELLRSTIGEQIQIETVLAGGLWKTYIDPPQLENAILNLCVNARDAMSEGGKLTIETYNCHLDENYADQNVEVAAGQYVLVSVTDTGTGMPDEVIERAFDPFYTTKEVGKGTGLGLSQVHGFVRQSGGHIKIYSEDGLGSTIKLYLPRYLGKAQADDRPVPGIDTERPMARNGETILVVEDEAKVRQVSVDQLRDLGYTVLHAANGAEALEVMAKNERIDLMFTDIVMPGMTGRVLADEAAKQRPDIKVLYTTGYTRNAVVHNGVLDPGTEFIAKPYTGQALASKVRSVLDG